MRGSLNELTLLAANTGCTMMRVIDSGEWLLSQTGLSACVFSACLERVLGVTEIKIKNHCEVARWSVIVDLTIVGNSQNSALFTHVITCTGHLKFRLCLTPFRFFLFFLFF